jgi:hypothetical protein
MLEPLSVAILPLIACQLQAQRCRWQAAPPARADDGFEMRGDLTWRNQPLLLLAPFSLHMTTPRGFPSYRLPMVPGMVAPSPRRTDYKRHSVFDIKQGKHCTAAFVIVTARIAYLSRHIACYHC